MKLAVGVALACLSTAVLAQEMSPEYRRNYEAAMASEKPDKVAYYQHLQPVEPVVGSDSKALPVARRSILEAESINKAIAQADASHSMAFLVHAKGKVQLSHYADGFSDQSFFNSYSSHKGIIVVAVMKAIDEGFLKLDDSVSEYVKAWAGDERRTITIADLLYNQSGLENPKAGFEPFNPVLDFFIHSDLQSKVDALRMDHPPATKFVFNHANTQVLESVLVAASGMRYAEFLSKYLWKPMGLADSLVALDREGGSARGVCCFVNTAPNWLKIGVMLANDGLYQGRRILSRKSTELIGGPSPLNPGFGMYMPRATPDKAYLAKDLYFFEGQGGQRLYIVPSLKLTFYRTGRIDHKWDDVAFANAVITSLQKRSK